LYWLLIVVIVLRVGGGAEEEEGRAGEAGVRGVSENEVSFCG
jgi:hypothetical protein